MQLKGTVVALVLAATAGFAQTAAPPVQQPSSDEYTAAITAILVDVVVRDRRGQPVMDLTAEDFEVYEDGVRQPIGSFSVVERAGGIGIKIGRRVPPTTIIAGDAGGDEASPAPAADDPPTMAIVFDALSPEALQLAQKASLSYLPMSGDTEMRIGVFTSEPGLRMLQRYTDDPALVRQAVRSVSAAGTARRDLESERRQALNERLNQLSEFTGGPGADPLRGFGAERNSTVVQALVEMQLVQGERRLQQAFETIDRDHRGYGSAATLLGVVQSLSEVPGRKTLVYFSEGLPASPVMQARLDAIVSVANRANVSVYTIDAAGLRAESTLLETRREIEAAGQERLRQTGVSRDSTDGPLMRIVERTEDLLRLDPQTGLARLADDTGGFLVRDTNNLDSAFRRIDEDNRFHYMLTYSPSNETFDGKFRTIEVKVKRSGAQVFSRKGYFALRTPNPAFAGFEAPAIAALDHSTPPKAFPIYATGLVFPDRSQEALVPIVVQVHTRHLMFQIDADKGTYAAQAVILTRIKDAAGRLVQTASQQYVLSGDASEVEAAKEGEILFYRQPALPPGLYTLESIVYDAVGERAGSRISTVTVPAADGPDFQASSLVLVSRVEQVPKGERPDNLPLYMGDVLLYPNAGEPVPSGDGAELTFYFAFHPRPNQPAPQASLEVLHRGRVLGQVPLNLRTTGEAGRVQHVGRLPVSDFPPGTYELRLRLQSGDEEEVRTAVFTIAE